MLIAAIFALLVAGSPPADQCPGFFLEGSPPSINVTSLRCYGGFVVGYRDDLRSPAYSAEKLSPAAIAAAGDVERDCYIRPEPGIPDAAQNSDYAGAGYDRGHLAPAADAVDHASQDQTCYLTNMVPQLPGLNRGIWRGIEDQVRRVAAAETLWVVSGPIYASNPPLLNERIPIPAATFKAVMTGNGGWAYVATNTEPIRCFLIDLPTLDSLVGGRVFQPDRSPRYPPPVKGCEQSTGTPDLHLTTAR